MLDVEQPSIRDSPSLPPPPGLFSIRSHRLRIGLLLMFTLYAGYANRMSMSTAIVCMVNNTLLKGASNDGSDGLCRAEQTEHKDILAVEGDLNWTPPEQSLVISISFYGSFVTVLISGAAADYFGPGIVLSGALVVSTVLTAAVPLLSYAPWILFLATRVIIGMGESFLIPAINCVAARWYPTNEKTTIAAIYTCGIQLAAGFASLIASQLCYSTALGGWPSIFYISGIISLVFIALWIIFGSSDPHTCRWVADAEMHFIEKETNLPKRKVSMADAPWWAMAKSTPIHAIMTCSFAFGFSVWTVQSFLPTYLKEELGLPVDVIGYYSLAPFAAQMVAKCIIGPLTDYVAEHKIVSLTAATKYAQCIGSIGAAVTLMLFAFVPTCENPGWALPILILYGAVFAGGVCGYYTSLLTVAPKYTGAISSITMVFSMLASIVTSVLVTTLTSIGTPYKWKIVFVIASLFQAFAGIHYLICGSTDEQPWAKDKKVGSRVSPEDES